VFVCLCGGATTVCGSDTAALATHHLYLLFIRGWQHCNCNFAYNRNAHLRVIVDLHCRLPMPTCFGMVLGVVHSRFAARAREIEVSYCYLIACFYYDNDTNCCHYCCWHAMQIFKSSSSSSSSMEALRIIKKSKKSKKDDKPAVFGVRLDPNSNQVPRILQFVVEFFDQEGVNIEGLFRISGAMSQMLALKAAFDNGMCTRASSCVCVWSSASVTRIRKHSIGFELK
jgi:hypothetical protein